VFCNLIDVTREDGRGGKEGGMKQATRGGEGGGGKRRRVFRAAALEKGGREGKKTVDGEERERNVIKPIFFLPWVGTKKGEGEKLGKGEGGKKEREKKEGEKELGYFSSTLRRRGGKGQKEKKSKKKKTKKDKKKTSIEEGKEKEDEGELKIYSLISPQLLGKGKKGGGSKGRGEKGRRNPFLRNFATAKEGGEGRCWGEGKRKRPDAEAAAAREKKDHTRGKKGGERTAVIDRIARGGGEGGKNGRGTGEREREGTR